jgi:surfactin synthase thioesterase subunit
VTYLRSFTASASEGGGASEGGDAGPGAAAAGEGDSESTTVVVFPQAGAGCLRLRATVSALPSGLNLLGVQMPGREDRLQDAPASDLAEVVDRIAAECVVAAYGSTERGDGTESRDPARGRPLVFLGVSLGAVIAYEVARKLESQGAAPRSLVVAAARSPEHWSTFPAANPPSAEVTALLHPSVRESESARYAIATMRADLRLMADYRVPSSRLTSTSLRSVSGRHDSVATTAQMAGWRDRSTDYRGHQVIDADHHAFMTHDVLVGMLSDIASETASGRMVRV